MPKQNEFLNPVCQNSTLDIFHHRKSLLTAVVENFEKFHGAVLDVGCGKMPYKSLLLAPPCRVTNYIGIDLEDNAHGKPDLFWDGRAMPLPSESIDCALATEVFEHCPDPELVMSEIARVLKPKGMLFFTVPFLWPLHGSPNDQYRYTPFAINRHLCNTGFEAINMKALGGWDASLAQMIGLWVCRRPLQPIKRRVLTLLALPIVRYLSGHDVPQSIYTDQTMITGIAGTAYKASL
jgi:SAM-dependent methyltransferase